MKTSESSPILVGFVTGVATIEPGRLGLTFAPGKKDPRRGWDRDLDADLRRLRTTYRVDLLVSLIEDHELELLQIPSLVERADHHGLAIRRHPIRDVSVPRSVSAFRELLEEMTAALAAGQTVVSHCRGGLGRAGLTAASCLARLGVSPTAAIAAVRAARPGAVETLEQERFVAAMVTE